VFEGALLRLAQNGPALAPLSQLPPRFTARPAENNPNPFL